MADKNKLAAGRRMLEEYKKKHRNNNGTISQPGNKNPQVLPSSLTENNSSPQNYVCDSGSSAIEKDRSNETSSNDDSIISNLATGISERSSDGVVADNSSGLVNGSNDKSDDQYVAQLVSELRTQTLFADNGSSTTDKGSDCDVKPDLRSAKDFFDSLPVLSKASADFSFNAQMSANNASVSQSDSFASSTATASSNTAYNYNGSTTVPSINQAARLEESFDLKNDLRDDLSDRSESVPVTPSEQDKSEASSMADQQSKHVSDVLEMQLQEIDVKLGTEIDKNRQLLEQLQSSQNNVALLEETLKNVRQDSEAREKVLEEKLKYHATTLEILVAEKTELQTTLTTCQESISQKAGEMQELQARLRASRHRVVDSERKLALAEALKQQHEKAAHEATIGSDTLKQEVDLIRKRLEEAEEEVLSLKHKVEMRNKDVDALQNELQEKNSQLSVSELRIQQLSSPVSIDEQKGEAAVINALQAEKVLLEQKIIQLSDDLKKISSEKEEANLQYQQYLRTLNPQMQSLKTEYENISNQRDSLLAREESLVEHVSNLEKQLQQFQQRKPTPPLQSNNELQAITKQLQQVMDEKQKLEEQLQKEVNEKNNIHEALHKKDERVEELERSLEQLEADRPDAGLLQAAIESDKVAASRAVAQNTNLKKQLEELQDAFIKLSNNKLELTERLAQEQHLSKELRDRLAQMEVPVEVSKNDPVEKDPAVIHHEETKVEMLDFCSQTYNIKDADQPGLVIDIEAINKLEEKFKRKMQEVAELSDEKQRLEHLVMQLQGETETIGEYIALYQVQRGMLRQRAQEKDEQMARLAQDREVLRNKLKELNNLVQTMLPNAPFHQFPVTKAVPKEVEIVKEENAEVEKLEPPQSKVVNGMESDKEETVEKIQALITEIGSSNLVTSDKNNATNFHSCPWCSGRLITV